MAMTAPTTMPVVVAGRGHAGTGRQLDNLDDTAVVSGLSFDVTGAEIRPVAR
jgi:hypothetical protein